MHDEGAWILRQHCTRGFMARRFTEAGLPSQAVSANTDSDTRRKALADLQKENGTLRALFAVDLFNEGVDLPASTRCCSCAPPRVRWCSCSSSVVASADSRARTA